MRAFDMAETKRLEELTKIAADLLIEHATEAEAHAKRVKAHAKQLIALRAKKAKKRQ